MTRNWLHAEDALIAVGARMAADRPPQAQARPRGVCMASIRLSSDYASVSSVVSALTRLWSSMEVGASKGASYDCMEQSWAFHACGLHIILNLLLGWDLAFALPRPSSENYSRDLR